MRLSKSQRKLEIIQGAKKVFLKKGFSKTTMEDIIAETSLSKGGFYHYYKNTKDIMMDIFMEGNEYRVNQMKSYIKEHNFKSDELNNPDLIAELMTEKVLDESELMELYAIFLAELKYDEELRDFFKELMKKSRSYLMEFLPYKDENNLENLEAFQLLTDLINTFILGANLLGARDDFIKNRWLIKDMFKNLILNFSHMSKEKDVK